MPEIMLREPSVRSLLVVQRANGNDIGTATAFVATHGNQHFLVTNWHVAAGRRLDNGKPLSKTGAVPDELLVLHNVAGQLGRWDSVSEPLYDGAGNPLWFEHPAHGRQVDVVALPLSQTSGVQIYPYDPANPGPGIVYGPSDSLSIIGFPFGITGGGALGIWVQGTVASEPDIEFNDLPCLLVDSRTRSGQSGSPVIAYRPSGYQSEEGALTLSGGPAEQFVGVYSGRINEQSDLGFIWKASALVEILNAKQRGQRLT
jgi:hypothetical protein